VRRVGRSAELRDTPWALWLDFPEATVVAPARRFLERMGLVALRSSASPRRRRAWSAHAYKTAARADRGVRSDRRGPVLAARRGPKRRDELGRLGAAFTPWRPGCMESSASSRSGAAADSRLEETSTLLEQRLAELNATRQDLDNFFALSLDMLFIAGRWLLQALNPAWTRTLGWSDEELRGKPYLDFVAPGRPCRYIRRAATASPTVSTVISFENRVPVQRRVVPVLQWKAISGRRRGVGYASTRDITEQKAGIAH